MSAELITYGSDRRLALGAGEAIRKPIYAGNWNTIRIGVHGAFDTVAPSSNVTGSPTLFIGVCQGAMNALVAPSADQVVGVRNTNDLTVNHGTASIRWGSGDVSLFSYKKIGTAETTGNIGSASRYFSNSPYTKRSIMIVEITKGSPSYTLGVTYYNSSSAAETDRSDAVFLSAMEASTLANAATVSGASSQTGTVSNEGLTGEDLDHILIYWDRSSPKFTFNLRHRVVA